MTLHRGFEHCSAKCLESMIISSTAAMHSGNHSAEPDLLLPTRRGRKGNEDTASAVASPAVI